MFKKKRQLKQLLLTPRNIPSACQGNIVLTLLGEHSYSVLWQFSFHSSKVQVPASTCSPPQSFTDWHMTWTDLVLHHLVAQSLKKTSPNIISYNPWEGSKMHAATMDIREHKYIHLEIGCGGFLMLQRSVQSLEPSLFFCQRRNLLL